MQGRDRRSANVDALARLTGARPRWVGVRPAHEVVPALADGTLLHAGPPLREPPRRVVANALGGALLLERRARSLDEGRKLLAGAEIPLAPAADHRVAAPLAGVVSPTMPLIVVRDVESGVEAYSPVNEGGGCVLRFGCVDDAALATLRFLSRDLGPRLDRLLVGCGGIDLAELIASAVHMGDDCHHRFRALQMQLVVALQQHADELGWSEVDRRPITDAVATNDFFPLNVVAAAAKAATLAADGVGGSSLVTCIARNGIDAGIRISAFPDRWFTAPVEPVTATELETGSAADADPDTGDSCIIEVGGLGACALPAAPTLARWFGGTPEAMTRLASEMYEITRGEHPLYTLPSLGFRGTPVGIDCELVVETGIAPLTETILVAPERRPPIAAVGHSRAPLAALREAAMALGDGAARSRPEQSGA